MRILDNTGLVQDPFHLGAVILDKLIGDLKSKLPFLNKKKGSEDDEDEEDDDTHTETEVAAADNSDDDKTNVKGKKSSSNDDTSDDEDLPEDDSFVGKIKSKINALKKKKGGDDVDEVSEDGAEAKPKKKPNFIVIIGAACLIGFIIFSDFGDEPEAPAVDPATMLKKKPKKEKPVADTPPVETAPVETAPVETTPTETVTTTPTETTPVETAPVETTPTETVTTTPTETTPTETIPAETAPTETIPTDNGNVDSVTGEDTKPTGDDLTDQILKDLESSQAKEAEARPAKSEYVAPPNYENVGRGLVYNCNGKHWACIDAPSYRTCEDNSSSSKFLKKKTECYPFNVYETQSGCEKMQNRMVSSSAKTEFCSEN